MAPITARPARAIAAIPGLLLLAGLTACGAPSDAAKGDFCEIATAGNDDDETYQAILDEDWKKLERTYHDQADHLDEVGTPEGISDDARKGFEVRIDALRDISADDIEKAVTDGKDVVSEDVDGDDAKQLAAFDKYVISTCAEAKE